MAPGGWLPPVAALSRASPGSERPRSRSPGGKKWWRKPWLLPINNENDKNGGYGTWMYLVSICIYHPG